MIKALASKLRFHPLFVIVIVLSLLTGYFVEVITLFGIVLVHELGHWTAAHMYGWRVKKVMLLPFGGVAEVEELGTVPASEEIMVALAGPLQNALMILIALIMKLGGADSEWWDYFLYANALIGSFNLLPVLPLDGGKIMQGLLSYIMPYHRAIVLSTFLSLLFSGIVVGAVLAIGIVGKIHLNILVISGFLLYSNWYSYKHIPFHFLRFLMVRDHRIRSWVEEGHLAHPIVVSSQRKIVPIMKLFMREKYHLIYVLSNQGHIQAVIPEQKLTRTYLVEKKQDSAVSDLFR